MKIHEKSITQKVMIILVLGIVLVMTVAGGFYYVSEKEKAIKQIHTIANRISERISNSLIYPLWNFSNEEMEKTISLEMADENIVAIILNDQNNKFFAGKVKDKQGNITNYYPSESSDAKLKKSMLIVKKKILKNLEPLGEVEIFFTGQYLNQYLRELIVRVLLLTIILSIFIVAVIFLSLKKIILNPLIVLQNAVQRLNAAITGEGDKDYRVMIGTGDEIDMLGKHFNAMADGLALSQQQLQQTLGRLQTLTDTTPDAVINIDYNGRIIDVNKTCTKIFGHTHDEFLGRRISDLGDKTALQHLIGENINHAMQGDTVDFEWIAQKNSKELFPVAVRFRLMKFGDEHSVLAVITDITERKLAEEALQIEKDKLLIASENARAIVNATTDSIYLFNTDGVVLVVNEAGATRLGVDFNAAIGTNVFEDVSADIEQGRRSRVERVILTKKPVYYEADRRDKWFDTGLYPVVTDGIVKGIVLYGKDITERKLAEEALRKEKEKFRLILENAPMGMAMVGKDTVFVYVNPKFKELFGYNLEDVPDGRTWFRKAFPEPEYRHGVISTWLSRDQDSKGRKPREIPKVFNTTCKDGTIKVVNFLSVTLETGEHIMTCEDVTELKDAEEKLLNERHRFKSLTESAPFGMVLIDNTGAFKYINPKFKELFGYNPEDVPDGRTWFRKAFPDPGYRRTVVSAWIDDVKSMGSGKATKQWIFDVQCKDRTIKTVSFVPVQLREGEYVMTGEDVTESKRAEEELRKHHEHLEELVEERTLELKAANKELEAFSYSVSHDLRAPLRAIDGFSRILCDDHAAHLSQDAQRYLRLVREGARQMGKLIEDLLSFSRLSRQPLKKQTVAPVNIVRQILEQLRYMQEGRRVEISVGELPDCQSDSSLLKVVYMNLLSNALKFTSKCDCAMIEIGCQDENGEHIYYVKDNGAGFNMKYVEKLFGVFQRLHRADEYEGTGVGLASVQRIINRHGGRIWVTSEVNKGTTFYFTLEKGGKLS